MRGFPKIPGLQINIKIHDIGNKNNLTSKPLEPAFQKGLAIVPIEIGKINQLDISSWEWSQLSAGIILIIFLIFLSISLQRLRLRMGFGYPELPP